MPTITSEDIVRQVESLPAFPQIVIELMADLEDDSASMMTLARHIERDPIITGKVLAAGNRLLRHEGWPEARDVYTAVSLIGFSRVKKIVLAASIADFTVNFVGKHFHWAHSLAVGIAAQELALRVNVNPDCALVAGMLHDLGQFWLAYSYPLEFQQVRLSVEVHGADVCAAEQERFGMDHCEIGRIVAEYWRIPADLVSAIANHHAQNEKALTEKIPALTHIADVIVQALDLPRREFNRVSRISSLACRTMGINWNDEESIQILGAIDARYQYASEIFS
ncbi:MAG: HDOD domain-containing protein [Zoogloeaceae bacterium]|jgi:putative nucleotidyltransferase with HDIG domain|nr:HDOD domain-containing protein [Zoogloeaceae bacterium]